MKKKIIPICIGAVVLLAGIVMLISSLVLNNNKNNGETKQSPPPDPFNLTDEQVGKSFYWSTDTDIMSMSDNNGLYIMYFYANPENEDSDYVAIGLVMPEASFAELENTMAEGFDGTLKKCDSKMTEHLCKGTEGYLNWIYEISDVEIPEGLTDEAKSKISPYYVEVAGEKDYRLLTLIAPFVITTGVIVLLFGIFGKKFTPFFFGALGVGVIAFGIVLIPKIRTIASLDRITDDLYILEYYENYRCDDYINADLSTNQEVVDWIIANQLYNLPIKIDVEKFGCASFAAQTADGKHIFGRNFDYPPTDTLVIHTNPKDGYESYTMCDLDVIGVGDDAGIPIDSFLAKIFMLATVYTPTDGFNETGLGVAILEACNGENHPDNGKSDIMVFSAVRGILDKCATVDEAVEFLRLYDVHDSLDFNSHLFIMDKSGKSVVVEWEDNEMYVIDSDVCTNFVLHWLDNTAGECDRFDTIKNKLTETNGILSESEAMELLATVSQEKKSYTTEWSCVYNLDDFTFDVCVDLKYDEPYSFGYIE